MPIHWPEEVFRQIEIDYRTQTGAQKENQQSKREAPIAAPDHYDPSQSQHQCKDSKTTAQGKETGGKGSHIVNYLNLKERRLAREDVEQPTSPILF